MANFTDPKLVFDCQTQDRLLEVIETSLDLEEHLRTAIRDAAVREELDFGDTEGAPTWLGPSEPCVVCRSPKCHTTSAFSATSNTSSPCTSPPNSPRLSPALSSCAQPPINRDFPCRFPSEAANSSSTPGPLSEPSIPASPSKKKLRKKAYDKRKRKQQKARKNALKDAFDYVPPLWLADKFPEESTIFGEWSAHDATRCQGAWLGRQMDGCEDGVPTLAELLKAGMKLEPWDGCKPKVVVDKAGRVVTFLAGRPTNDPTWSTTMHRVQEATDEAHKQLRFGNDQCIPPPPGGCEENRRSGFRTATAGVSYGGGQKVRFSNSDPYCTKLMYGLEEPGFLKHTPHNQHVLDNYFANPHVQRALGFGSSAFAYIAPDMFAYYRDTMKALHSNNPKLRRFYKGTIFPVVTVNFGPQAISVKHKDHNNLADGLCWILANGDYDPTRGGHLVLWELGLVIEFPPGSSVLIPSAVIAHGNVAIQPGEVRTSMTQYAAGGLFRWVEYGFKTEPNFKKAEPKRARKVMEERPTRWRESIKLFPKYKNLAEARKLVFS
ncbi:hypothetical protein EIP86_010975 [Pleurotus ostreatoroseus]|nr:hypothetical protein EIP86_010975 [Pleurotus ostreatoroseus]